MDVLEERVNNLKPEDLLDEAVASKKREFDELVEKKQTVIGSIVEEQKKEKENLAVLENKSAVLRAEIPTLQKQAEEIREFIEKEKNAQKNYREVKKNLDEAVAEHTKVTSEVQKEQEKIQVEKEELEFTRNEVSALIGKIASYVKAMEDTAKTVNEGLASVKLPMLFHVPPKQGFKITLKDFPKQLDALKKWY